MIIDTGLQTATDILFPRRCPVCDGFVPFGRLICPDCLPKLQPVREPRCYRCGKELKNEETEYCYDCRRRPHEFIEGRALFDYRSAAGSIYRFKYAHRQEYAAFYGSCIARRLGPVIRSWQAQALIPVPIHKSRLQVRGYNQALCLARQIGSALDIPVCEKLLIRARSTVPQKELDEQERQINLKNAFKIQQNSVKLESAIMIDDIYTTGSTIDSCARALKAAGVKRVYFIALAIGKGL